MASCVWRERAFKWTVHLSGNSSIHEFANSTNWLFRSNSSTCLIAPSLYESPTPETHFLLSFVLFKHHRKRAQIGSLVDHSHIPLENGGPLLSWAMAVPGRFCLRWPSNFHKCLRPTRTFVQSSSKFLIILPRRLYSHSADLDAIFSSPYPPLSPRSSSLAFSSRRPILLSLLNRPPSLSLHSADLESHLFVAPSSLSSIVLSTATIDPNTFPNSSRRYGPTR
jgi:hypothetical protein